MPPLKIILEEYRKAVVRGEIELTEMKTGELDALRKSAHMLDYSDLLSRPKKDMNTIWEPIIEKIRFKKMEYEKNHT